MKKVFKIFRNALIVIIAILILYSVNALVLEGRSVQSRFYEDMFRVLVWIDGSRNLDKVIEMTEDQLQNGREAFVWPESIDTESTVEKFSVANMDYYVMNNKGKSEKKILYLHGGAYKSELVSVHVHTLDRLAADLDASIIIPVYPLVPEYNHKDSYPKVLALYQEMLKTTDPENIVVMGDSAGGGHSLGLALMLKEVNLPQPGRLILLSPWLDVSMSNQGITEELINRDPMMSMETLKYWGELWAGDEDVKNHIVSPIYGDHSDLAPVTIYVGDAELCLPDSILLHEKLQAVGNDSDLHVYKNMMHVFPLFPTPEAKQSLGEIISIINEK